MSDRVVVSGWLALKAAVIDWLTLLRTWHEPIDQGLVGRLEKEQHVALHLRWSMIPALGLPLRPFRVWLRTDPIPGTSLIAGPLGLSLGSIPRIADWDGTPQAVLDVTVDLGAGGSAAVSAFDGLHGSGLLLSTVPLTGSGSQTARLRVGTMRSIAVTGSGTLRQISGVPSATYANLADWHEVELVGLPVDPATWAGSAYNTSPQGVLGSLRSPRAAAIDRLHRGAPLLGWPPFIASGEPAPGWHAPNPNVLVDTLEATLLPDLADMLASRPEPRTQADFTITRTLPPPVQVGGTPSTQHPSSATTSPLATLLLAVTSDPFASLALGYGTAILPGAIPHGDRSASGFGALDVMVSLPHRVGFPTGFVVGSGPIYTYLDLDLADIVVRPATPAMPPGPANLASVRRGRTRPSVRDLPWSEAVTLSWDRQYPAAATETRASGYAIARQTQPGAPSTLLLSKRAGGGATPFAPARDPHDPSDRVTYADGDLEHPVNGSPPPAQYAVSASDIFGRWTLWNTNGYAPADDPVQAPSITSASLQVGPPAGSLAAATLIIDVAWDWQDRSPEWIEIVSSVYVAPVHAPLTPPAPSGGLQLALGGPVLAPLRLTFSGGDTPSISGPVPAGVTYLSADGTSFAGAGSAGQGDGVRRYRVAVSGLTLDFSAGDQLGVAVTARGAEHVRPFMPGPLGRTITAVAPSPVPPPSPPPIEHPIWSSLPDTAGLSHAHLTWDGTGASSWFVYEATESAMLVASGLPAANLNESFVSRLATLRTLDLGSLRHTFRRINATAIAQPSMEIELPRGSAVIHTYVITAVSGGQIESPFPTGGHAFFAYAVPRLALPTEPGIAVRADLTLPKATVDVAVRGNVPVSRIELFRTGVDVLATGVDTMGPPLSVSSDPGWTVQPAAGPIATAQYGDATITTGWRRTWYRAIVWAQADENEGIVSGRSPASVAMPVLIPPPHPPDLSDLRGNEPGSTDAVIVISWTSDIPVGPTPVGTHAILLLAHDVAAPAGAGVLRYSSPVEAIPSVAAWPDVPPWSSGISVYRVGTGAGMRYYAYVPRPAAAATMEVRVRIVDPLSRNTSLVLDVPPMPPVPVPDLEALTAAYNPLWKVVYLRWTSSTPPAPTPAGSEELTVWALRLLPPAAELTVALESVPSVPADLAVPRPPLTPANAVVYRVEHPSPHYVAWIRVVPPVRVGVRLVDPHGREANVSQEVL